MIKDALAIISVAGFILVSVLCLIAYRFGESWAAEMMKTVVPMVVQAWILNFGVIVNHRYGSSQGSEEKSKIIDEVLKRLTPSV